MLKMKKPCDRSKAKLRFTDEAFICSYECTFCAENLLGACIRGASTLEPYYPWCMASAKEAKACRSQTH
ncbi:DUF1272 domain-containing protein [Congregibacter variabilis]|uniref:DUF1272 domain-containing protein n=1 Tax=Congregibacter variabilis TaxID=3081200 RepID=UPI00388E4558